MNTQKKGMTGKDIITVGIFSAIYFVINFAFMLLSGLHPLLWILMPGLIAVFAGIPFLMMCTKVPKTGAVVLMGFITALIYFVTGQFTVVILIAFAVSCILAELCRICSHYRSFRGNALAYVFFSLGMIGSPLPVWIMRDSFLAQISQQGMPEAYVSTLAALTSPGMIVVLVGAPIVGAMLGILLANVFTAVAGALMSDAEGFAAIPNLSGILVSFGVSVGIGVLFGYLPANKAAKLNPIDALRYD